MLPALPGWLLRVCCSRPGRPPASRLSPPPRPDLHNTKLTTLLRGSQKGKRTQNQEAVAKIVFVSGSLTQRRRRNMNRRRINENRRRKCARRRSWRTSSCTPIILQCWYPDSHYCSVTLTSLVCSHGHRSHWNPIETAVTNIVMNSDSGKLSSGCGRVPELSWAAGWPRAQLVPL